MRKILLVAVIVFLVWLFWPGGEAPPPISEAPAPAPTAVAQREAVGVATPRPERPDSPRRDTTAEIRDWARRQGVQVQIQGGGGKTLLKIAWQGDNATLGGDFVMKLYHEGLIGSNFEQVGTGRTGYDRSGRRVWMQEYRVVLR